MIDRTYSTLRNVSSNPTFKIKYFHTLWRKKEEKIYNGLNVNYTQLVKIAGVLYYIH